MFLRMVNYVFLVVLFVLASIIIVIYASGYRVDLVNREISQTATIEVSSVTNGAGIYINGSLEGTDRVVKRGLPAGNYTIDVKKTGYHTWTRQLSIAAGMAEVITDPILFLETPVTEEFTLEGSGDSLSKIAETDGLGSGSGEIYQNGVFVTRFGSDISGLCWYTDRRYIAFSQDGWLKIMGTDGTNIVGLLKKESASPVVFVNSGRSVIFESSGKFYRAQIR